LGLEVLYLIRHSKPVDSHPRGDRHRPLSSEGRLRLVHLVPRAVAHGFDADFVLSSPYVRAVETRDRFLRLWGQVPGVASVAEAGSTTRALTPDADPDDAVAELAAWGQQHRRIAVFTHNPLVTDLAEVLAEPGSAPGLELVFDAPTLLALTFDHGFGPRLGRPAWILHP
jgi:phosphohistidine phosphatase SixA